MHKEIRHWGKQVGVDEFAERGTAEFIVLLGCFHLIGITSNGYDESVPVREDKYRARFPNAAAAGGKCCMS